MGTSKIDWRPSTISYDELILSPMPSSSLRDLPRLVSLAILLVLIVLLGMTFYQVVAPFLLPLFMAGMTAVVCQPLFRYFLIRTRNKIPLASGLTTASIMAALMVPLVVGTLVASLQLYGFAARLVDD